MSAHREAHLRERQKAPFPLTAQQVEHETAIGHSVLFYDPPGRLVATLHPDSTWALLWRHGQRKCIARESFAGLGLV
jgi:hypothetical protein